MSAYARCRGLSSEKACTRPFSAMVPDTALLCAYVFHWMALQRSATRAVTPSWPYQPMSLRRMRSKEMSIVPFVAPKASQLTHRYSCARSAAERRPRRRTREPAASSAETSPTTLPPAGPAIRARCVSAAAAKRAPSYRSVRMLICGVASPEGSTRVTAAVAYAPSRLRQARVSRWPLAHSETARETAKCVSKRASSTSLIQK